MPTTPIFSELTSVSGDPIIDAGLVRNLAAAAQNVFIQPTQPTHPGPYVWWDTSGGNLTVWIEDGL